MYSNHGRYDDGCKDSELVFLPQLHKLNIFYIGTNKLTFRRIQLLHYMTVFGSTKFKVSFRQLPNLQYFDSNSVVYQICIFIVLNVNQNWLFDGKINEVN